MDYKELTGKSDQELRVLLSGERQALRELRFQAHERQLKNVRALRGAKQTVARILSALRARRAS